jgi:O-succinylbenzoic acid--CoA ligase
MNMMSVWDAFEKTRILHGGRPAVTTQHGSSLSYNELHAAVTSATEGEARSEESRPPIALTASITQRCIIDCWRAFQRGGIVLPVPDHPLRHPPVPSCLTKQDGAIACIIETSGSTGRPKAVRLSHSNLLYSATAVSARLHFGPEDRWLLSLPPFHIGGFSILIRCAVSGGSVVIPDGIDRPSLYRTIVEQGVTHLSLVPAMVPELLACGPLPSSLRVILLGGQAVDAHLRQLLAPIADRIVLSYGATETSGMIASGSLTSLAPHPLGVGTPLPDIQVSTLTDGRLRITGPAVALGYDDGTDFTGQCYDTPDTGSLCPDGTLCIEGRLDDVINTGGKKIAPITIQNAVAQLGYQQTTVVVKGQHRIWGESPLLIIEGNLTSEELTLLEQQLRELLPAYAVPKACVLVPVLPRIGIGKINREAVRQLPTVIEALEALRR